LCTCGFFRTQCFDSDGFDSCSFGGDGFLLGSEGSRSFGGGCNCSGLLLGGGLNVGSFPTTTDWFRVADGCWLGDWLRDGDATPTAGRRRRRRLFLCACALFSLPTCSDACNLVVGEHAHVAANGNVHLPKKCEHFVGRHREFAGQLVD
jgi:hypothetical protein